VTVHGALGLGYAFHNIDVGNEVDTCTTL
jgi:hypothetical protein